MKWDYDIYSLKAGYTKGYRVRLYDYKKSIVKTYYVEENNVYYYNGNNASRGSDSISGTFSTNSGGELYIPVDHIPRLNLTYIDITPYYISPSGDKWYQDVANSSNPSHDTTVTLNKFVHRVYELPKPVIDYPINNSTWINDKFRICFTLPKDLDYDYVLHNALTVDESTQAGLNDLASRSLAPSEYRYGDITIKSESTKSSLNIQNADFLDTLNKSDILKYNGHD